MAPLDNFLENYYSDITETKFQPIFKQPSEEMKGLVCIFHGLGSDPHQYNHLVDFLTSHNYAACSFGLPGHRSSIENNFYLTKDSINDFVNSLTKVLSNIHNDHIKLFFIGISFGASFARHFADQFQRPLINAAPFIEPYQWSGYFILKFLQSLNWIPLLHLGSQLSNLLPKVAIVSSRYRPINHYFGLRRLPASAILNSYLWAQKCHFAPKKMSKTIILFAKKDQTVNNPSAKYAYPNTQIEEYNAPHNILSELNNNTKILNNIKKDILNFIKNDQAVHYLYPGSTTITYMKNLYITLLNAIKKIINKPIFQIKY